MKRRILIIGIELALLVSITYLIYNGEKRQKRFLKDYQVDLSGDTVRVYSGARYVGKYIITDSLAKHGMDSLILKDNE